MRSGTKNDHRHLVCKETFTRPREALFSGIWRKEKNMSIYHIFIIIIIVLAAAVLAGMRQIGNISVKQAVLFMGYGFIGAIIWAIVYMIIFALPFVARLEHDFPLLFIVLDVFIVEAFLIELFKDKGVHYGVEKGKIPIKTVFDAVVFGALVGIGFGVVEHIINMVIDPNPGFIYFLQEVGLVLSNIAFGAMMGFFIGMSHYYQVSGDDAKSKQMLVAGLVIPSVLHGIPTFLEELVEHHMIPEGFEWLAVIIEVGVVIAGIVLFFKWKRSTVIIHED